MEIEFLKTAVVTYVTLFAGFCLRYFTIMGGLYVLLQVVFKRRWLARRIQQAFPPMRDVRHEIRWSLINGAFTGITGVFLYRLVQNGGTSLYFDIGERGWLYFVASIVLGVIGYETWIYWQHRTLHTPWLYEHVHHIHHVTNPTAFASLTRHPFEACIEQTYYVLLIVFVPLHPLAIGGTLGFFFANGIIAHMGYEFYPPGFTRNRLLGWMNTSTYHNMHHSLEGCHFGNAFNFWDRWMGTYHSTYHATFEAVKARLGAAPLEAPPVRSTAEPRVAA
jgi:sterol desaturase/sphingolipid hydroxylase (fatty acid hydroxylase superfamily)